jgi:hypothetical protein
MFVGEKKWNLLKCFKINKKLRAKIWKNSKEKFGNVRPGLKTRVLPRSYKSNTVNFQNKKYSKF